MPLTRRRVAGVEKAASLGASLHRYVGLNWPFEGWRGLFSALKAGFKRIKSYL